MRSKARNRVRWKSLYSVVSPKINADGTYVWNFGPGLPVDVAHLKCSWNGRSRMNQHDFLEIDYLASGKLVWQVRDRFVTQQKGDLFLVSSWLYHRIYEFSSPPAKLIELAFVPEVIPARRELLFRCELEHKGPDADQREVLVIGYAAE